MATSKTLTPTNVTISIPEMTDSPDASFFSNCVDKEADAINSLNSKLNCLFPYNAASSDTLATYTLDDTTLHTENVTATHDGYIVVRLASEATTLEAFVRVSIKGVGAGNTFVIPSYFAEPCISFPCRTGDVCNVSYKKQSGANNATIQVRNSY